MIKETLTTAILLTLLGIIGYFATGMASITALIPTFFGIVLFICGFIGGMTSSEKAKKHIMHTGVLLALVGFIFTARGILNVLTMLSGAEVGRPAAAIEQSIMALICLTYLVLSIRWFISNRRKKSPRMII